MLLAALSFVLAAVEHGWTKLSRNRLTESAQGPSSRGRIERMLEASDAVDDALIVLRVSCQVAFVMLLVALSERLLSDSSSEPLDVAPAILLAGGVAFGWITLFCRVLPGEMSVQRLEAFVRTALPVVWAAALVIGPSVGVLRRLARRFTGHTPQAEAELYNDEILSHLEEGEREGLLEGQQADMIEAVLELTSTEVRQLMTPRTEMAVIEIDATVAEAREHAQKLGHSRYPLVEGTVDEVVGVLHVKDLLGRKGDESLREAARKPWFVPESKFCTDLLTEFKRDRNHLAIVLDEYGGTAGIVTIEDVLEEIVGEIDDEFDETVAEPELKILDDHHAVANGSMHVDELNDALGVSIPEDDDYSTLGGFIFHTLGRLPDEGEELRHANLILRIDRVIDRRVDLVSIEILEVAA